MRSGKILKSTVRRREKEKAIENPLYTVFVRRTVQRARILSSFRTCLAAPAEHFQQKAIEFVLKVGLYYQYSLLWEHKGIMNLKYGLLLIPMKHLIVVLILDKAQPS